MKKGFLLIIVSLITSVMIAGTIDKPTARKTAKNFYYERINPLKNTPYEALQAEEPIELKLNGQTRLYAINMLNGGFVLVSAYDGVRPVPGYSVDGKFQSQGLPPQLEELIALYMQQIAEASLLRLEATSAIEHEWERLSQDDPSLLEPLKNQKSVEPLLHSNWDQGKFYNEMCPADPAGPGGHCYAGCVATALGQVVNYFRWPLTGEGSYTYACPPYGTLTGDFGNTHYEWDKMPTELTKSGPAIALLLHHLGIACDMVYGPNGSGMYNHKAAYALRNFFRYSPETVYVYRDSTSMDWDSLLIAHLDRNIPLYYAGWSVPNINGHAFVCDGYQDGNYYHFNWGWSGSYDGYFYTDALNPGGSNFNLAQEVIINAFPDTVNNTYPYYCQGDKILEATDGTIDDGSGPVYDYLSGTNCSWLIAPEDSVENISLEFLRFHTSMGDVLSVYDGEDASAPLLGTFEGDELPDEITSTGDKLFLTFTSNGSDEAPGWLLKYTSEIPVYCAGMTSYTEQSGYFSDGSGPRDYHNSTTCMWMLDPPGASELTLNFLEFNTEQDVDKVQVFDLETQELLAEYSGDISPAPVTSPSGRMFVTFSSNYTVTAPGWEAYYETDLVGTKEYSLDETLQVYPNPARDKVNLKWRTYSEAALTIELSNISGQIMFRKELGSQPGTCHLSLDVSGYGPGIYFLKFILDGEMVYRKLILE